MKKTMVTMLLVLLMIMAASCGGEAARDELQQGELTVIHTEISGGEEELQASTNPSPAAEERKEEESGLLIQISDGENEIIFQLNDSIAAKELYDQLPLSVEVENYSDNEKIFYPPQALGTNGTPEASGAIGSLAYYAPWGDVVMFYDSANPGNGLYELGQAVEGRENIASLEGRD